MKYIAPTIVNQHNALTAILGAKGPIGQDNLDPNDARSTVAAYESDE